MICKNCGQELSNESIFCNKCGSKVETTVEDLKPVVEESIDVVEKVQTVEEKNIVNNVQNLDKKKILIIGTVALVAIILVSSLFGGGRDYQGSNTPVYNEDDFGKNNEVVTQPQTTEAITVAKPDIDVVYNDIIYCKHGSDWGAVKILDYNMTYTDNGQGLTIYIDFEKVKNSEREMQKSFAANIYFYDASGNVIDSSQALYISNFRECEIGRKFKDECQYFGKLKAGISAQAIAKIEIIGG